jgi:cytoskeletal protein RodZ
MQDRRDDYEPIIATRRSREPLREDTQPLWRVVLALIGVLVVVGLLAWWWIDRSSSGGTPTSAESESAPAESFPETHVEQQVAPPARDAETGAEIPQAPAPPSPSAEPETGSEQAATPPAESEPSAEQAATPSAESEPSSEQAATPEEIPEVAPVEPTPPAAVSVRFMSPDPQVRIELHRPADSSPFLTSKAGEVVDVPPGTYRVVASGPKLQRLEQEVTFDGERPLEYTVELCAEPKYEHGKLTGQVVEKRGCASTEECESMFLILGEYADELVRDRDFRTQQCEKWRSDATPEGTWTLNINCDGATPATTCSIVIAEGACTHAGPRRSARGTA